MLSLHELIGQIPHLALHAKSSFQTLLDEAKSTSLYVDTIVADDWLFGIREMLEDRERPHQGDLGVTVLIEYTYLQELRKICLANVVPPILIISPSPHYANEELRKISTGLSKWLTLQYANQLFNQSFRDLNEVIYYTADIRDERQLIRKISNPDLIWEEGQSLERKIELKLFAAEGGLNISGFPPELATSSPASSLIIHEMAGFDVLAQQYVDDEILNLDPRVSPYHWDGYLWSLSHQAVFIKEDQIPRFKEETAIARILDLPDMEWLGNIPTEKLIELRAQGRMEEMRSIIRDSNKRLKYEDPQNFLALAAEIKSDLETSLRKHKAELKSSVRKDRWRIGAEITGFIVSGSITAASTAVPLLAIPAAIIGLGSGVGSIKDIIKQVRRSRERKAELPNRPIGILWDAYQRKKT